MSSGGASANRTGKMLEENIKGYLEQNYTAVNNKKFFESTHHGKNVYSKQVIVGKNIYGMDRKVDFILYHPVRWDKCLVIQCKWQAIPGSVDEKYPFEVECIRHGEYPTIIVLDGAGYRPGAREWLMKQCDDKLLRVCTLGDFARLQGKGKV
ncbi:MAG: hypothetical protein GDA53_11560 [Rhodobacteraceae bacterium]|nr:hypothetical protein [Paracoccaceae bacterium]